MHLAHSMPHSNPALLAIPYNYRAKDKETYNTSKIPISLLSCKQRLSKKIYGNTPEKYKRGVCCHKNRACSVKRRNRRKQTSKKTSPFTIKYITRHNIEEYRNNSSNNHCPNSYRKLIIASNLCEKGYDIRNHRAFAIIAQI